LLSCGLALLIAFGTVQPAAAAEVLQVRSASLLQVGDQNRSYPVRLGCVAVAPESATAATVWMRQRLPRRTRVNLRPLGSEAGVLLAQVRLIGSGEDLGTALVTAGLASPLTPEQAPDACPVRQALAG
jgi:endonuclease YncB( thermonuclease family)